MKFDTEMKTVVTQWETMSQVLSAPTNGVEYDAMVVRMNALLDYLGDNEDHPLNGLLHLMGDLVAEYDLQYYGEIPAATGGEMLKHFLQEHNLKQSDLPEVGSQGVISEIVNGKRELTLRQIKLLAVRFNVPKAVFLD